MRGITAIQEVTWYNYKTNVQCTSDPYSLRFDNINLRRFYCYKYKFMDDSNKKIKT